MVWNFFYQSYLLGNSRTRVNLDWVGGSGMQRSIATDVFQHFFDGQPEKYRPAANPQNYEAAPVGFPWRPLQSEFVLVKRPVWIVEGVPKDKYYL